MSAMTFATLKFANRLTQAGLTEEQAAASAEARKEVFAEALDTALTTKLDIARLEAKLDRETASHKRMVGVLLAIATVNFTKQFF